MPVEKDAHVIRNEQSLATDLLDQTDGESSAQIAIMVPYGNSAPNQ